MQLELLQQRWAMYFLSAGGSRSGRLRLYRGEQNETGVNWSDPSRSEVLITDFMLSSLGVLSIVCFKFELNWIY